MKKNLLLLLAILFFNNKIAFSKEIKEDNNRTIKTEKVLALVNGKKIYESSFDKQYKQFNFKGKKKLLDKVISSELLVQYAEKSPLYKNKILIKETDSYAKIKKRNKEKFSDLDYRMVLGLKVIEELAKNYALNESNNSENIHQYYLKRKRNFKGMDYVDAYAIKTSTEEEAKNIIKKLNNKNKNKKDLFLKLSKKYQKIEETTLGRIYKFGIEKNTFNRTLFQLKTDEHSPKPIQINDNFYIFYVAKKGHTLNAPLEKELQKNIQNIIQYKSKNEWINSKLEELKEKSKVIYY